jgi:hypothetical protein
MSLPDSKFSRTRDVAFAPPDAEQHPGLSIQEWLDLQTRRLGAVGKIARGELMPEDARERALAVVAKEFQIYQRVSREYEARRQRST